MAAMCDYAIFVTYIPQNATTTKAVLHWLVRGDAVEGRDYKIADLVWLWDETTQQDKSIIELNAAGVASRAYVPGPYSRIRERNVAHFLDWYLSELGA